MKVSVINSSNPNNIGNRQPKLDKTPSFKMEWNVRTFLDKEPVSDPKTIQVIMQKLIDILTQPSNGDKKACDININFRKHDEGLKYLIQRGKDIDFIESRSQLITVYDAALHFLAKTIEAAMRIGEDVSQLRSEYFDTARALKNLPAQKEKDLFLVVNASSEKKTVAQSAEVVIDSIDFKSASEIRPVQQPKEISLSQQDEEEIGKIVLGAAEWPFANFAKRTKMPQLRLDLTS